MKLKLLAGFVLGMVLSMSITVFAADLNTIIATLSDLWAKMPVWLTTITYVVTLASTITMLTPTTHDDQVVNFILRILNWLSLNIFKNKNADDVKPAAKG